MINILKYNLFGDNSNYLDNMLICVSVTRNNKRIQLNMTTMLIPKNLIIGHNIEIINKGEIDRFVYIVNNVNETCLFIHGYEFKEFKLEIKKRGIDIKNISSKRHIISETEIMLCRIIESLRIHIFIEEYYEKEYYMSEKEIREKEYYDKLMNLVNNK